MTRAKRFIPELTDAEEAAIQAGIAKDPDNPEWTDEDWSRARPAAEVLPPELYAALTKRSRGRPKAEAPKQKVTMRLDADVIEGLRATGPGWQVRVNDALRRLIRRRAV
jgi:uncharacterized protein (DUF4415 family)